jgi:hypothetical protein
MPLCNASQDTVIHMTNSDYARLSKKTDLAQQELYALMASVTNTDKEQR